MKHPVVTNVLVVLLAFTVVTSCQYASHDSSGFDHEIVQTKPHITPNDHLHLTAKSFNRTKTLWGFVDRQGNTIIPPRFYAIQSDFIDGRALVWIKDPQTNQISEGMIDKIGNWAILPQFRDLKVFQEGLARANHPDTGQRGYIREDGTWAFLLPENIRIAYGFSEGVAPAMHKSGRWGYINRTGDWVIRPRFAAVGDFQDGKALAQETSIHDKFSLFGSGKNHGRWGCINRSGTWIIRPQGRETFPTTHLKQLCFSDG